MEKNKRAAFLDRDGILNKDHGYVYRWDDFCFIEGIFDLLTLLQKNEYSLIVITNQSGIARGFYDEVAVKKLHTVMTSTLEKHNIFLTAVYYCPHLPTSSLPAYSINCECRKPKPGMIYAAAKEHKIDLNDSILIGDKVTDIEAGIAAGLSTNFLISDEDRGVECERYSSVRELYNVMSARLSNFDC